MFDISSGVASNEARGIVIRLTGRLFILIGSFALVGSRLVVASAGAATHWRVVSSGHATGQYAVAETSGPVNSPKKIELSVTSKPALSGLVQWTAAHDVRYINAPLEQVDEIRSHGIAPLLSPVRLVRG